LWSESWRVKGVMGWRVRGKGNDDDVHGFPWLCHHESMDREGRQETWKGKINKNILTFV